MAETLYRASLEIKDTAGRTLSGIAMPFDRPTPVQDMVRGRPGPRYTEAFSPTSADETMRMHPTYPVFEGHNPNSQPLGVVTFHRSDAENALLFDSPLSKTRAADDALELVNDGAMRSVSIGFVPGQAERNRMIGGTPVDQYRTAVTLRHLALAPTGYGQYDEAMVQAVRAVLEGEASALQSAVDAALDKATAALQAGDLEHGRSLAAGAAIAVDALLATLEETDEGAAISGRMAAVWSLAARRRVQAARPELPTF